MSEHARRVAVASVLAFALGVVVGFIAGMQDQAIVRAAKTETLTTRYYFPAQHNPEPGSYTTLYGSRVRWEHPNAERASSRQFQLP